jgi:ABC-2 type transport system permease protein
LGLSLGSKAAVDYLAIGNSVVLVCMEVVAVIPFMLNERRTGAISLHLVAPTSSILAYLSRNIYCPIMGIFSSTFGLFVIAEVFRIPINETFVFVPLLIALIGLSVYAYAFTVAAIAFNLPSLGMAALNFSYLSIMTFCGVDAPVGYWPKAVRVISDIFPVTHGLVAVRDLLGGMPAGTISWNCLLEAIVGTGWLGLGSAIFYFSRYLAYRRGNIEVSAL